MGNLIVKDNALVEASHKLGEVEQRLVLLAILKARNVGDTIEQLKDKMLTIHADDYIANFGGTRQGAYKALKQAVMGLYRAEWGYKYLTDKGEQRVRYERFTQSADYGEGEGTVKFMFSTAIIPMLVELERRFTTYEIEQVANLTSRYAMRLYEMIIRHFDKEKGNGVLRINLDELRFRLGLLPNEYASMSDFKKRVFEVAIKQINENTDLMVTYEQRKQGRIIVGFDISSKYKTSVKKAKNIKENADRDPDTIDLLDNKTDKERSKDNDLIPRNDTERQIIAEKNTYADQHGYNADRRQNLVRQGLTRYRQAAQEQQTRQEQEQADRQAQKAKDKVNLELAKQQYERILASSELINAYIANNDITAKRLSGLQAERYKKGNFKGVFQMERHKFEKLHDWQRLNLKFLDNMGDISNG